VVAMHDQRRSKAFSLPTILLSSALRSGRGTSIGLAQAGRWPRLPGRPSRPLRSLISTGPAASSSPSLLPERPLSLQVSAERRRGRRDAPGSPNPTAGAASAGSSTGAVAPVAEAPPSGVSRRLRLSRIRPSRFPARAESGLHGRRRASASCAANHSLHPAVDEAPGSAPEEGPLLVEEVASDKEESAWLESVPNRFSRDTTSCSSLLLRTRQGPAERPFGTAWDHGGTGAASATSSSAGLPSTGATLVNWKAPDGRLLGLDALLPPPLRPRPCGARRVGAGGSA